MNTVNASEREITAIDLPPAEAGGGIIASLRCHPGSRRSENQDCVAHFVVPLGQLFLVADGVGGQGGGRRASRVAAEEYGRFLAAAPARADPARALQEATVQVNCRLAEERSAGPEETRAMASTVALLLLHQGTAHIGHLGDSRVYRMRNGALETLTRDHSVVRQMVDHGILTPDQALSHPKAHILTRSLGQPDGEMEVASYDVAESDLFLLCSDGLWAYVPEASLSEPLAAAREGVSAAADALLNLALAAGGEDNISLEVVRIAASPAPHLPAKRSRTGLLLGVALLLLGGCAGILWWLLF